MALRSPMRSRSKKLLFKFRLSSLPIQHFGISVPIIPTGGAPIRATTAHGVLTITNGSIISQTLPKGMIIGSVVLDYSVFVPAGSVNGYGYATVSAHALVSGKSGNIPAYQINQVEGSSVYVRNLTSFTGGKDSYSIPLQLPKDRQTALDTARFILAPQTAKLRAFLAYPCNESTQIKNSVLRLFWMCQYVTFSIPSYMTATHIKLIGKNLLIDVRFVARPRIIVFK